MGHVSMEHLGLMLEDRKKMLETLELIKELCPKARRSRTSNAMAPKPQKLSSSQIDAHPAPARVESTLRRRPLKKESDAISEAAVKICIKVWLEVRISILSPKDAYSGISQESLVRISWFQPRPLKRVRHFSV